MIRLGPHRGASRGVPSFWYNVTTTATGDALFCVLPHARRLASSQPRRAYNVRVNKSLRFSMKVRSPVMPTVIGAEMMSAA
jgi:hypothetical protein